MTFCLSLMGHLGRVVCNSNIKYIYICGRADLWKLTDRIVIPITCQLCVIIILINLLGAKLNLGQIPC